MRLVFAGTPEVAVAALDALLDSEHEVLAVLTRPDAARGRGRTRHASPVARRAEEAGLEVLRPEHPRDRDFVGRLVELAPDCCPVVAYGALVPESVIAIPRHGWINLHFSLLPRWRGAAPVQHAVMAGDQVTGASTFSLVRAMDAGPVYDTITAPIETTTTAGDLLDRLAVAGAQLLVRTLDAVAKGTAVATAQPDQGITLAPKISVADARLDWERPAVDLDRQIRGCHPAPGAWTQFRGDRFKIISARAVAGQVAPGELRVDRAAVHVGTGAGLLALQRVQPTGRSVMPAADWARGVSFDVAEKLT